MNSQQPNDAALYPQQGDNRSPKEFLQCWFRAKGLPLPTISNVSQGLYHVTFFDSPELLVRTSPAEGPKMKRKLELQTVFRELLQFVGDTPTHGDSFIQSTKRLSSLLYMIPQWCFKDRMTHHSVRSEALQRDFCLSTDSSVRTVLTADPNVCNEWILDHIVGTHNHRARTPRQLKTPLCRVIGYDTESLPFQCKLAFIQLSTETDVLLFEVFNRCSLPYRLRVVLETPHIAKVGLAMDGEEKALRRRFKINLKGLVELDTLSQQLGFHSGSGLKALADRFLGISLCKDERLTLHKWGIKPLGIPQIDYAATDAWIAYHIHRAMTAVISHLDNQGITLGEYCAL